MPGKQSALDQEQERLHKAVARKAALDGDERSPTMQLGDRRFSSISIESWMPRERVSQRYSTYRAVPTARVQTKEFASQRRWRIELHGNEPVTDPIIRLDVVGDTIVGRGSTADVDLRAFNADNLGVSRRHALLRPTPNHLYLIDLSSTNGTLHNATPVTSGVARPLENNDVITLGRLIFTVHILGLVEPDEDKLGDVGHVGLPASQQSEELPQEEHSKHPTSPTIHIPRPTQLQETLLPNHVQRALKQLESALDSAPATSSGSDEADSAIAPLFGAPPASESLPGQPTGPMLVPGNPDHSRLPEHIRRAAGEAETQRMPDAISSLLRRWFNRQSSNSQDKTDRLLDQHIED